MNRKLKTEELQRLSAGEFKTAKKLPVVVVLDNVRSAANVGSIFRTMDAFRMEQILLCGITPTPPHREINKTALGATETVDWKAYPTTREAISDLKEKGYHIWAVEQTENSQPLQQAELTKGPICLVFGNEVDGISQEVIDLCSGSLEIEQQGTKHSLNVAVCAGIVLWEIFKLRN